MISYLTAALLGDVTHVENIYIKGRSSTPGRKLLKGKITMASRFSGSTSNGEFVLNFSPCTNALVSTLCSAEITFKTDPKNTDYAAEHGASRNFEPWREEEAVEQEDRLAKMEEEENNPMKALENRTVDSKREMDVLDALQDIRARNARNERVGNSVDLLANIGIEELENEEDKERKRLEEEDEKLVREVFAKVSIPAGLTASASGSVESPDTITVTVKRKADDIEPSIHNLLSESTRTQIVTKASAPALAKKKKTDLKSALGIKVNKGKGKAVVK